MVLPLTAYLLLKTFTDRDVALPRHYLPDSTTVVTKGGKQYMDTAWHTMPDFNLRNQQGEEVSWSDIDGKVVVASFFFTRCPTICPTLTANMKQLQAGIQRPEKVGPKEADFVHYLSFSVDPERDSVKQLKRWADRFEINPANWWLLTGDKQQIYDMAIKEMRVPAVDGGEIDSNFLHTDVFVLLDKQRRVRGYYHTILPDKENGGFKADSAVLAQLSRDVVLLALEKQKGEKFFLAGKLWLIAIIFVAAAMGLVVLFRVLKKEKNGVVEHSKK